ncbi:hypothetical protein QAD02_010503 [Eretmocerus hayati]|uniref:Uncharacterized protein n=1 Tax=Eretmocerus hayati TaxID=131215 RepID=A0ACC2NUD8_9HYME|nr:hypothetical protein QAD02_010503 [Eretmocerus hayati]
MLNSQPFGSSGLSGLPDPSLGPGTPQDVKGCRISLHSVSLSPARHKHYDAKVLCRGLFSSPRSFADTPRLSRGCRSHEHLSVRHLLPFLFVLCLYLAPDVILFFLPLSSSLFFRPLHSSSVLFSLLSSSVSTHHKPVRGDCPPPRTAYHGAPYRSRQWSAFAGFDRLTGLLAINAVFSQSGARQLIPKASPLSEAQQDYSSGSQHETERQPPLAWTQSLSVSLFCGRSLGSRQVSRGLVSSIRILKLHADWFERTQKLFQVTCAFDNHSAVT